MNKYLKNIIDIDKEKLKYSFLYTFIIGFAAHGYAYSNFQPNHDSLAEAIGTASYLSWKIQLGRYLKVLYDLIFGKFNSFPWSNGVITLVWISISAYLICKMFHFDKKFHIAIVCGILTTNITVIALTATYAHDLDSDACALLLSVLGTDIWQIYTSFSNKTIKDYIVYGLIIGLCLASSLALYQAFICVFVSLVLMISTIRCLNTFNIKDIWKSCFYAAGTLVVGGGIYYLGLKVVHYITGVSIAEGKYNSVSNAWQNSEPIKDRLVNCLKQYVSTFLNPTAYVSSTVVIRIVNYSVIIIFLLCLLYFFIKLLKEKQGIYYVLTIIFFCILLPFAMNGMRLLNQSVHHLMIYAFWLSYIFVYYLSVNIEKNKLINFVSSILLSYIVLMNIQTANACYVKKTTEKEATLSLMTRVIERIESLDGYKEGETPVVFVGSPNEYLKSLSPFDEISTITGMGDNSPMTYYGTNKMYINMIMKIPMDISDLSEFSEEIDSETIAHMESYPSKGSVKIIDGIVIVKFE